MHFLRKTDQLGRRTVRSAAWTMSSQLVKAGVQLLTVVILSRILTPAEFGLVAMAAPAFALATLFADLGLTQATVQRAELNAGQVNALFWMNGLVGAAAGAILLLAAPWVGVFYGDDRVTHIVQAFGGCVVLTSLGAQHLALLARDMRFRALSVIDIGAAVLSFVASVSAAFAGAGYFALVVGTVVGCAFPTIASWLCVPWRPTWPRQLRAAYPLLGFGLGVTGFNFANFLSRNLDNVLLGWRWGALELGPYDRAYRLLMLPLTQVVGPVARVMLPALSAVQNDEPRYKRAFQQATTNLLLIVTPGILVMTMFSDDVVRILLGPQWSQAAAIFQVLGLGGLVVTLNNPSGWLFVSQGKTRSYALTGLLNAVTNCVGFAIGLSYGAIGVATAYVICEYGRTPIVWWLATRRGPVSWRDVVSTALPHVVYVVVISALFYGTGLRAHLSGVVGILIAVAASYLLALSVTLAFQSTRTYVLNGLQAAWSLVAKART